MGEGFPNIRRQLYWHSEKLTNCIRTRVPGIDRSRTAVSGGQSKKAVVGLVYCALTLFVVIIYSILRSRSTSTFCLEQPTPDLRPQTAHLLVQLSINRPFHGTRFRFWFHPTVGFVLFIQSVVFFQYLFEQKQN